MATIHLPPRLTIGWQAALTSLVRPAISSYSSHSSLSTLPSRGSLSSSVSSQESFAPPTRRSLVSHQYCQPREPFNNHDLMPHATTASFGRLQPAPQVSEPWPAGIPHDCRGAAHSSRLLRSVHDAVFRIHAFSRCSLSISRAHGAPPHPDVFPPDLQAAPTIATSCVSSIRCSSGRALGRLIPATHTASPCSMCQNTIFTDDGLAGAL
ncbi:hypothetical protein BD626DRAFT_245727 [Schizophyllum amplum]|uniref:Uncharacterized protein n=1 Tax=Schizophyllum amplum TaxID=97359 RepID=A0A550BVM8_9AGAR|nr:hypothetical protein BD626DRAFT_245727 [Auriculariopsis ampla]